MGKGLRSLLRMSFELGQRLLTRVYSQRCGISAIVRQFQLVVLLPATLTPVSGT